ncbi:lincomycin resistance protein [Listeria weihenstephanensis FSL R9-0317]|uniref:DHA2 family efflux MFS transporter permease subunit n=1 Tax=Listeria weihenstephanensis TaxID=1006155 RepID=A0A1S7FXF0_9LIST|nr:DHA2 family efflux MFS transporter permease subunit [Listeria weihenstephanensis]AQY52098.1 multidrug transporter [Listeria weihenstephanensis]EUJ34745.1 lincomycin resistance protein [Listeria weihenstephanensis FSL R9-0317]MBC1500879.1 DHA2 family efflux MFS transporter permease subunit [Listeria weihenstephanensis]
MTQTTQAEKPVDIQGKPYNRMLLMTVMLVGAFVAILNQTILSTALPHIMVDLNITASTGQWLTTAFLLTNGIMIPITAMLIGKINSKTLFLTAMIVFTVGTVISAFSDSFALLLTGRIIQAAGAGILMPLMQTIFLLIFPPDRRGAAMGMVGLVIAFAPAIGPTLSGWIVDSYDWHMLFIILIPIAVIDIIFAFFAMRKVVELTNPKIDILSIALSTIGFGALLYGFSSAGTDGWTDGLVLTMFAAGVVGIILFVWRQLVMEKPMLELRVFKSPVFTLSTIISAIVMMSMIGAEIVLPLYIQNILGETALHSGLLLLPGAIVMGVMSPITGIIFDKIGPKLLAIVGMTLLVAGTIPFMFLTKDTSTMYIIVFYAVRFFGISMVMMPMSTAGMNSLPLNMMSHGTAVNNTIRQVAGSIGTAILITVLSNVTKNNMPGKALAMTDPQGFQSQALTANLDGMKAAFIVAVAFAVIGLILSLFVKDIRPQGKKSVSK